MKIQDIKRKVEQLIFPPICRVCGKRQSIFSKVPAGVLCPACARLWQGERGQTCTACDVPHERCACLPTALKTAGVDTFVHLAPYRPGKTSASAAMILRGKDHNDREMFRFLASELAGSVREAILQEEEAVVTYVPRRRAAVKANGHDHARQIALFLADELGLPLSAAIRRRPLTHQQKQLSAAAREQNAAKSFELDPSYTVVGKTFVLIDDVCTTGTSLAACASLLEQAGAQRVICAVIAKTEQSR